MWCTNIQNLTVPRIKYTACICIWNLLSFLFKEIDITFTCISCFFFTSFSDTPNDATGISSKKLILHVFYISFSLKSVPPPTMQLVIRDDIDSHKDSSSNIETHDKDKILPSHKTPPAAPASIHQAQFTRRPASSASPPSTAPPSHRHPRVRPDFMQLVFKETKEGDVALKRERKKTVKEEVIYNDQELFRETERDLKPWQRYFRNVFQQRGIKSRQSSSFNKLGQFQQQHLTGRQSPHTHQLPRRRQETKVQKTSPLRSVTFPSQNPVPSSARVISREHSRRPLLPLGLVPPSHPITQVLPASARILGVSPVTVRHQHNHGLPQAQTAVMSLDDFLRDFPHTEKMKTIPVEVSGHESDVVARLASGESDRELFAELDDLIATRTERKSRQKSHAFNRHGGEKDSAVTVRPRGGNDPFFFSSAGGDLSNRLDSEAAAPALTQQFGTTPQPPFLSAQDQRGQKQQRYHEQSFVREPDLEFGFRPLQDNPFFFTTTEKPRSVNDLSNGRGSRGGRQHSRQPHQQHLSAFESSIDVGLRDISAVAADAVRKVKATQFDMRNLFFIPSERGKSNRNSKRGKKKRKNAGHGFFTP